jgi:hypothetical protein
MAERSALLTVADCGADATELFECIARRRAENARAAGTDCHMTSDRIPHVCVTVLGARCFHPAYTASVRKIHAPIAVYPIADTRDWPVRVYLVEKLEILRPAFFSRKSLAPKMARIFLVLIIERLCARTSSISRIPLRVKLRFRSCRASDFLGESEIRVFHQNRSTPDADGRAGPLAYAPIEAVYLIALPSGSAGRISHIPTCPSGLK